MSTSRVRYAHAVICRSLGQAVKWKWTTENFAKDAFPPGVKRTVATAPSPEEQAQILTATSRRSAQMTALFALLVLTGARQGEGLAVQWCEHDAAANVVMISKSIAYTAEAGIFEKPTKTYRMRKVSVDEIMESLIVSQIEALQNNVEAGFDLVADPYLFCGSPDGSIPMHPDTPSKMFRKVRGELGFPYHLHQE